MDKIFKKKILTPYFTVSETKAKIKQLIKPEPLMLSNVLNGVRFNRKLTFLKVHAARAL